VPTRCTRDFEERVLDFLRVAAFDFAGLALLFVRVLVFAILFP
jgi:hypothetical protein